MKKYESKTEDSSINFKSCVKYLYKLIFLLRQLYPWYSPSKWRVYVM